MPKRPCLDCGKLTANASRCDDHQAAWQAAQDRRRGSASSRGYGSTWRRTAAQIIQHHKTIYGNWCPGYKVAGHPADDLTVDHIVPKVRGGTDAASNLRVLCRPCNSRKAAAT